MASRRARIKVAPKLLPGRSKSLAQPGPPKPPALAAKESCNNPTVSQLEAQTSSLEGPPPSTSLKSPTLETTCPPVNSTPLLVTTSTPLHATISATPLDTTSTPLLATNSTLLTTTSPAVATLVSQAPAGTKAAPPVATSSLSLVPLTTTTTSTSREAPNSDWEDEEFTYNSVEVSSIPAELTSLINQSVEVAMIRDNNENSAPVTAASSPSAKLRLGLGKNKFKPNLFTDRRARHTSGPRAAVLSPRPRAGSGSGTDSETEAAGSPARRKAPLLESLLQPAPARVRRATETRGEKERSQFMRRKQEHKKRFLRGVPERGNMTMFDLIYYNPEHGQRMSIEEEDQEKVEQEKVDSPGSDVVAAAVVVDAEPDTPPAAVEEGGEGEASVPCPQVKIGSNGEIILDDSSLVLETTDAKKAKDFMESSPVAVVENNRNMATNYGTWSKKRKHVDWSQKETLRFYKALAVVGSDFSMMESIFKNRTRQELKLKFKKEERLNNKMVDKCLRERGMYTELEDLMQDSEEDTEVEEVAERGRRKVAKKRPRGRYRNMGYYDSSSGGEEADAEASRSPARKKAREGGRSRRRPAATPAAPQQARPVAALPAAAAPHLAPAALSGVQFPPGLLAANPGLVGARPGSLVVVASPSKTDPGSQLLHVYMVSSRQEGEGRSRSPRVAPSSPHRSPSPRLTLDPAVVRAVDRARVAGREGRRSRANSECESSCTAAPPPRARSGAPRQRTCSEGSQGLRTELVRQRFLSGSARSVPGIVSVSGVVANPGAGEGASLGLPVARKSKPDASQDQASTSQDPSTSQGLPSTPHSPP